MDEIEAYLEKLKDRFSLINPNEYYLSYSGGKDSHLIYWFIKEYAHIEGIETVGVDTFMEHQEILDRIYKNCNVVLKPKLDPFQIKERYGIPCFTKWQDSKIYQYQKGSRAVSVMKAVTRTDVIKFKLNLKASELVLNDKLHKVSNKCDLYNKKQPLALYEKRSHKKPIIGVRGDESLSRKAVYKDCFDKNKRFTPIYDLTDDMQQKIYSKYNIEVPSLYKYLKRTGCMGCPYGIRSGNTYKELALLPKDKRDMVIKLFKESYEVLGFDYTDIQPIEYYLIDRTKKECLICGKEFTIRKGTNQEYCSNECQHKSMMKAKQYNICIQCGNSFIPHHYSKGLFCSRKCSGQYKERKETSLFDI